MDSTAWIQIVSFHIVQHRMHDGALTLCGRTAVGEVWADLPPGVKSCETCLRVEIQGREKGRGKS